MDIYEKKIQNSQKNQLADNTEFFIDDEVCIMLFYSILFKCKVDWFNARFGWELNPRITVFHFLSAQMIKALDINFHHVSRPQCQSKYCELPVECRTCGLTLATSLHLARSLHHLAPVKPFDPIDLKGGLENLPKKSCYACQKSFTNEKKVRRLLFNISFVEF